MSNAEAMNCAEKIRIIHVVGRMQPGGTEIRTLELMQHLDRNRYQFDFCALSGLPGDLDHEVQSLGGKVHYCSIHDFRFVRKFMRLLGAERYQVVHSHVHMMSGAVLALAFFAGIPVRIAHFRSSRAVPNPSPMRSVREFLLKRLIGLMATHILSVSRSTMIDAWYDDWYNDARCRVVYCGVDMTRFQSLGDPIAVRSEFGVLPDSTLLIHVGNFTEAKNHSKLLTVFAELLAQTDRCYLLLVGEGSLRAHIENRIDELQLRGHVILAGRRRDVPRLLAASDLMIFPSLWEGLPGSVLEAVAAGVPVLASDIPAMAEIQACFDQVYSVGLTESDLNWAQKALDILRLPRQKYPFADCDIAPFSIKTSAQEMCAIWESASRDD